MREGEFKKFYKRENNLNSLKEAEKKIELFWSALIETLKQNKKVVFRNYGRFEIKEVKSRKIKIPNIKEIYYTKSKKVMVFKCGNKLRERINEEGGSNE